MKNEGLKVNLNWTLISVSFKNYKKNPDRTEEN